MSVNTSLHEADLGILEALQENSRISVAEMGRRIGLAASAVHERVRKLEARGLILGYETRLEPALLGLSLLAFVFVRAEEKPGEAVTGDRLAALPNVLEVHHIAGEDCYLMKVRAENPAALGRVLRQQLGAIPTVSSTKTTIVLETVKESGRLQLSDASSR